MAVLKWYNKWHYVVGVIILIIGLYFAVRKGADVYEQISLNSILQQQIKAQKKEIATLDSLYKITVAQKDKIRIIKEKIDISDDIKKLENLLSEYEAIKKDTVKTDQPTPQELLNYLNKEF